MHLCKRAAPSLRPLYRQALSQPGGVMTPDLGNLLQRPIIRKAMGAAANDIRNGGGDPAAVGLHFDEAGNMTATPTPTAEAWDLTKKALGYSVERDAFGNPLPTSKSPGNYNINAANQTLSRALSDALPGYGDALKTSGDYLRLQSAFDRGQKAILNPGITADQVANHVATLSPGELNAYRAGIANKLFNMQQNGQLGRQTLPPSRARLHSAPSSRLHSARKALIPSSLTRKPRRTSPAPAAGCRPATTRLRPTPSTTATIRTRLPTRLRKGSARKAFGHAAPATFPARFARAGTRNGSLGVGTGNHAGERPQHRGHLLLSCLRPTRPGISRT